MTEFEDETVITLRQPVTLGETYTELKLREPTGAEWLQIDALENAARDVLAISLVAGLPSRAVEKVGVRDILKASAWLGRFFAAPAANAQGDDPALDEAEKVFALRKPIEVGGTTYSEINLREPLAGEWIKFDPLTGPAFDIASLALVAGVPDTVIRQMGVRDIIAASKWISRFLDIAPQTGA